MKHLFRTAIWATGLLLVGCASVSPPNEQLAVSQAAVSKAEQAEAANFSPVAFNAAQEKLARARSAMEDEDYLMARRLAEQAEADADLAFYAARNAQAQRAVRQLQEGIETLRRELESGS